MNLGNSNIFAKMYINRLFEEGRVSRTSTFKSKKNFRVEKSRALPK